MRAAISASLIALIAATPGLAQQVSPGALPAPESAQAPDEPISEDEIDEIIVIADRVRGQVQTASAPVLELNQEEVAAYGAASIADLVEQLTPAIGGGNGRGGRPVFLVNGQRITNFREIGRYPPEAIKKVEVLPEEVALKFGFSAAQRVINFILQDNYASREVEVEYGIPSRGGYSAGEAELGLLRIDGVQRLNATLSYEKTTPLTEAERGVVQTPGNVPTVPTDLDPANFRSLVSRNEQLEANVTGTYGLGESGSAGQFTLNSQWIHGSTTSFSGLDLATAGGEISVIDGDPIERRTNTDTLSVGAGYNTRIGDYQFQATFDGGLTDTDSRIDRRRTAEGPVIADVARSKAWTAGLKTTLIGQPLVLPAGELGVTLNAGYDWDRIESFDTRTQAGFSELTRGSLTAGANVTVPIASRSEDAWAALGDVTFTLGGGVQHLSDFGTLGNVTGNLVWRPTEPLTLQASYSVREAAPGLNQLGGPTIVNFNVPVYDFRTNQSVLVIQTSGGNPFLQAETQRDLKLSASYDIDLLDRANVLVEYYRNRSDDVTSGFPLLTPAIEAAFPNRISRDEATGRLTAIDVRPLTFSETRAERLRYGFNLFGRLGKRLPEGQRGGGGGVGALMARAGQTSGQGAGRGAGAAASATGPAESTPASPDTGQSRAEGRRQVGMMGMDPQRLAQLREQFCASPAGTIPDLSALPQQMQDRLKGEDGTVDPARVAVMRERVCSADSERRFDPARFAAMRQTLCADPTRDPDPTAIPEELRSRLAGPDGSVPAARLKEFRDRICALPAGQGRGAGRTAGQREAEGTSSAGSVAAAPPPASGGGGGPRGGGRGGGFGPGGGGGDGQGRWNLSLYHTINLENSVLVAPGGPYLDLLGGDATSGGGVSRHLLQLEGGTFYRGIGLRLSGNYQSATTVSGTGLPGSSDLFFDDIAKFNLRLFAQLDQQKWLVGENPGFFKNARLTLGVSNIFDARQRVTDADGDVPLRYQPFLIDPTGRFIEIEFRKLF